MTNPTERDLTDKLADALEELLATPEANPHPFGYRSPTRNRAFAILQAYRTQQRVKKDAKMEVHREWTYSTPTEDGVYLHSKDCCTDEAQADEVEVSGGIMFKHGWPVEIESGGIWMRKPLAKGEA